MSDEAANSGSAALAQPPVIRIAPQSGRWAPPLEELWSYRELLYFFVWRDIKIRYKQTVIGAAWAVLQPFLTMLIFSLFFGKLAHIPSEGLPYPIFFYCALLPWMYFATSLQNATNTIVENQRLITKVYFPRLALPLSAVLSGLVDFGVSFLMFIVMMIYYGTRPSAAMLWLPAFLVLAILTALGVGLWLSALNAVYRDVRYVVPFMVQFWMFASPVVYPSSLVPEKWRWLYALNPMAGVIEGFRWALAGDSDPPRRMLLVSAGVVVLVLLTGLAYFQKMETTIADVV
ncbi:MAG: ABC transporter permease [Terriglobales bacterium]|jgi:lipopolysaccharide transport system permease protein